MGDLRLPDATRAPFEAWLTDAVGRSGLALRDVRKGIQSVSSVYVQGRGRGPIGPRSESGRARRAALATYYAPLHFLLVYHALVERPPPTTPERIVDLGCGTGACSAAAALALGASGASILGLDPSSWALGEARRTWSAFGLRGRTQRGSLPAAQPRMRAGDLALLGFALNEFDDTARAATLENLARAAGTGACLLIAEPLSGRVSPWWNDAAARLAVHGLSAREWRHPVERPGWIADLDRASGLDHRELGARLLASWS